MQKTVSRSKWEYASTASHSDACHDEIVKNKDFGVSPTTINELPDLGGLVLDVATAAEILQAVDKDRIDIGILPRRLATFAVLLLDLHLYRSLSDILSLGFY